MVKRMEKENSNGTTVPFMKETGSKIQLRDMGKLYGTMAVSFKDNGPKTK